MARHVALRGFRSALAAAEFGWLFFFAFMYLPTVGSLHVHLVQATRLVIRGGTCI